MSIRTFISTFSLVFSILILFSCNNSSKKGQLVSRDEERPASFVSDDELLDFIQKTHFNYMWEGAEKTSGLAPERIHMDGEYPQNDADVVTTGGSGFGIAGLVVAMERGFIPREEGVTRLLQIADYLATADRYHGVWSHWINGPTGKTKPFGSKWSYGKDQTVRCKRQWRRSGRERISDAGPAYCTGIF